MVDYKLPHKRFLELMMRDHTIHEVVLKYELGAIQLASEKVKQKKGFSTNAEKLLQIGMIDQEVTVTGEEDALNRIHAFFVALEMLGHCVHGWFEVEKEAGEVKKVSGGTLEFMKQL